MRRRPGLAAGCLCLAAGAALAQPIYRSIGPDGRVTYSDRPMAASSAAAATAPAPAPAATALPYALQQVANRFPVTLYTAPNCAPCDSARQLLQARGVPFSERTVTTHEDIEALQRLTGDDSLPAGSIGGQQLRGFAAAQWSQYLDAAGYPATSQLPANYRPSAPRPLVALQPAMPARAADAGAAAPSTAPAAPAAPRPPAPANPAGIQF